MNQPTQGQMSLEVLALEQMLEKATNVSPELFETIRQTIQVTDLVSTTVQTEATHAVEVAAGTNALHLQPDSEAY